MAIRAAASGAAAAGAAARCARSSGCRLSSSGSTIARAPRGSNRGAPLAAAADPDAQQHGRPRPRARPVAWSTAPSAVTTAVVAGSAAASAGDALPGFRLDAAAVQVLLKQRGCSMDALLLSLLQPASRLARPPVSNYHVGAVGLASSGAVYIGVNLEFPGAPLSQSVHAEQFLMANLLRHGERGLDTLAVSAAPCGHCRQFYSELACADSVRFLFGSHDSPKMELYSLRDLLPARFGPLDLLEPGAAPLLMEPQGNRLAWHPTAARRLEQRRGDAAFGDAAAAALAEARESYSPYTRCPSGVALIATGGRVFAGRYVENAAHNPGLAPMQAAIASAIVGGLGPYEEIQEVVVVERHKAAVQHAGVARVVGRAATGNSRLPITVLPVVWE